MNHIISKQIVEAQQVPTLFGLEDLEGIGKKNRGKRFNGVISNWSRFQLRQFIEYKALQNGHFTMTMSPAYTSQTCSHCHELGVRNKGFFHCNFCGYSCNADLNASFNLEQRAKPLAIALGLSVNKPIVANELFHCDSFPEFSDKPMNLFIGN
jgi:putative transposase